MNPRVFIALVAVSLCIAGIAVRHADQHRSNDSHQLPPITYTITKECRQYIAQHLNDPNGEPINQCTVDFVPPYTGITASQLGAGAPMPVGMTCNMKECFLDMKGVLQQYGTRK